MLRSSRPALAVLFAGLATLATAGCAAADTTAAPQQRPVAVTEVAAPCGVDLASPTVQDAIGTLPPDETTGRGWSRNPAGFQGNFDPCATLSTVVVPIEGATGSSPEHALMFHQGQYVGTATAKARGFTSFNAEGTTDDTVVLTYRSGGTCTACNDGTRTDVRFHWDGTKVEMIGAPPN